MWNNPRLLNTIATLLTAAACVALLFAAVQWLLRSPLFDRCDLGQLRKGYYGASIMPVAVMRELTERLPQMRLWNFYGQTEIAPLATVLKPEDQLRKPGSAGRPALNVETRVVDDAMRDVKVGEVGEIVHRSPQLLQGYFNDPERTAAAFEGGWFHSGDLATIDAEGYLQIVDRKKDMIISGGEKIYSTEVEHVLYAHPAVLECAVFGIPDETWGERVEAAVVLRADESCSAEELQIHARQQLAGFKVPRRIRFLSELPKTGTGKIAKRWLRDAAGKGD